MIVALDLSLTCSGFACSDGNSGILKPPTDLGLGFARLSWIRDEVVELTRGADLVVIEGYAFGVKNQRGIIATHGMGELVRFTLWELDRPHVDVPPATLKMYATGRGNAPKPDVFAAAIRHLGYQRNDHNEADALWLLQLARDWYHGEAMSTQKRQALEKVRWPDIPALQSPDLLTSTTH